MMLKETKRYYDLLNVGDQIVPSLERTEKNTMRQDAIERFIQLRGCSYVDELVSYSIEQDLKDILVTCKMVVPIVGDEYANHDFAGRNYFEQKGK